MCVPPVLRYTELGGVFCVRELRLQQSLWDCCSFFVQGGVMGTGTLFGVSVGPGDPELLTLKAVRTIQQCSVIAAPCTRGGKTLALDIASSIVPLNGKKLIHLEHRMTTDKWALLQQYEENTRLIAAELDAGANVALLNLGDVSIYSTCSYIMDAIRNAGYSCQMIPGVPSFCACAAAAQQSLVQRDQPLTIFPGSYRDIDSELDAPGSKVLMKPASSLPALRKKILEKGLQEKCRVISDCGLASQKIGSIEDEDIASYFTTILIRP
jgi:precorrin-2 C(20)-methyltransferase